MRRNNAEVPPQYPHAPLWRRFAAMFYDSLLVIALVMVTTGIYMAVAGAVMGTDALKTHLDTGGMSRDPFYKTILFLAIFFFFSYFWRRLGQTLGMQVWRIRVQNADGSGISWTQCILRFMVAIVSWLCLGLGFFWMLWDKDRLTWHDRYSESQVVLLPPKAKTK